MSRNRDLESISLNTAEDSDARVVRTPYTEGQPRRISIAEARRKAFEASDKAQQAQIVYAEEEARRWYDYKIDE